MVMYNEMGVWSSLLPGVVIIAGCEVYQLLISVLITQHFILLHHLLQSRYVYPNWHNITNLYNNDFPSVCTILSKYQYMFNWLRYP